MGVRSKEPCARFPTLECLVLSDEFPCVPVVDVLDDEEVDVVRPDSGYGQAVRDQVFHFKISSIARTRVLEVVQNENFVGLRNCDSGSKVVFALKVERSKFGRRVGFAINCSHQGLVF